MSSGPETPDAEGRPDEDWPVSNGVYHGESPKRGPVRSVTVAVIAVVAAAIGAGVALTIINWPTASPAAAAAPSASASPVPGTGNGGIGNGIAPGGGGTGGTRYVLLVGKVTAVSGSSITIGGNGPSVTASVTGSAKVTGRVSGISGVKVGDEVSAQLTETGTGGKMTVMSIQDPAGTLPTGLPTSISSGT